MDIHH
ncbi:hypothetical protein D043_2032A, partial [Vibrio parahaemolyticus EKP-021]